MWKLHRAMTSGATAVDLPFGGLTATSIIIIVIIIIVVAVVVVLVL